MNLFQIIWGSLGALLSILSFFPLINSTHWFFRLFDFIRLQLLFLLLVLLVLGFIFTDYNATGFTVLGVLLVSVVYQLIIISPYFPKRKSNHEASKNDITLLSINVMQKNNQYDKLIQLVKEVDPDILLTMETNKNWEDNLRPLEAHYKQTIFVPKENRYGMHLYSKLPIIEAQVHYLVAEDYPSIEVTLKDKNDQSFIFWGIHPPPPSPTEKSTSRQKDAELMKVAKITNKATLPVVASGDFNNVAWSKASKLFSKVSTLKDARINRGFHGTFPAQFWFLRFPIDLLFHSKQIKVKVLKVLSPVGSDHLPLLSKFEIISSSEQKEGIKDEQKEKADKMIMEGKKAVKEENN